MQIIWTFVFLIVMVAIFIIVGVMSRRRVKSEDDYATARQSYSWIIVAFALCATYFSGATFLGGAGLMYNYGFPSIWYSFLATAAAYLGLVYLGRVGSATNNTNTRSMPELIGVRFNSNAIRLIGTFVSFFFLFSIASQVSAGGQVFSNLLGIDYKWGLVLITVIILAYLIMGGAHANIMTAAIQFVVMFASAIICIIFIFAFKDGGGFVGVGQALANINTEMGIDSFTNSGRQLYASAPFIITIFLAHFTVTIQPNYAMKFGAIKNKADTWKMVLLCGIMAMICGLGPALPGLWTRALGIELTNTDLALVALLDGRIPGIIYAFIVVGILCAILSTGCGLYLSMAETVSNDLYRCTIAPWRKHTEKQIERNCRILSRVFIVVFAVVAALIVINPPQSLTLLLWVGSGGLVCTINGALVLGLVSRKVSTKAVLISMIWCVIVYMILIWIVGWDTIAAAGLMFVLELASIIILSCIFKDKVSNDYLYEVGLFRKQIDKERAAAAAGEAGAEVSAAEKTEETANNAFVKEGESAT